MAEIKPIFRDLAHPELLRKCLHGGTQNPNESINNVIWSRVPKRTFVTLVPLSLGVHEAILTFNEGNIAKCRVLRELTIEPGGSCTEIMQSIDFSRIQKSEQELKNLHMKSREKRTRALKKLEDLFQADEDPDNPSYAPGFY